MANLTVLIDNGHGSNTPGKCSPDKRLLEYAWARDFAQRLNTKLKELGIDSRLIVPETIDVSLPSRVSRVNAICDKVGSKNVLLISIHNNAAGADGKWHNAFGWQVYVSKNASSASKTFANMLTTEAETRGLVNPKSKQPGGYWTWSWTSSDIYILKKTKCPAVLTENLFQDNLNEVTYLLSEKGKETLLDVHVSAIKKYISSLK